MMERYILKRDYNILFEDYKILYLGFEKDGSHRIEDLDKWCYDDKICESVFEKMRIKDRFY
jgi:hypothetical protein